MVPWHRCACAVPDELEGRTSCAAAASWECSLIVQHQPMCACAEPGMKSCLAAAAVAINRLVSALVFACQQRISSGPHTVLLFACPQRC
jgi:hypothetical protein